METVIVLAIVCSMISITISGIKNYQARLDERIALQQFKNGWKNALNEAFLRKTYVYLSIHTDGKPIHFWTQDGKYDQYINLPKTLAYVGRKFDADISNTGSTSPVTMKFHSTLNNHDYVYKIQMDWGEIVG